MVLLTVHEDTRGNVAYNHQHESGKTQDRAFDITHEATVWIPITEDVVRRGHLSDRCLSSFIISGWGWFFRKQNV